MDDTKQTFSSVCVKLRRHGFIALAGDLDRAASAILGIESAIASIGSGAHESPPQPLPSASDQPGDILRSARKTLGLTADALGAMVGIKGVSVRAHETGQNAIRADIAQRYAEALGVSAHALVFAGVGAAAADPERQKLVDWMQKELAKPGRSQSALGKRLGIDQSAVSRIVRGQRSIKAHEMPIIEKYLNETEAAS